MLESRIRELLNSYRGSHKSLPDTERAIGILGTPSKTPFVAPCDGWAVLKGTSSMLQLYDLGGNYQVVGWSPGVQWNAIVLRVKRGWTYYADKSDSSDASLFIIPDIDC